jgi:hypothetical protein
MLFQKMRKISEQELANLKRLRETDPLAYMRQQAKNQRLVQISKDHKKKVINSRVWK